MHLYTEWGDDLGRANDNAIFVNGNTGETIVQDILFQAGLTYYHDLFLQDSAGQVTQVDFLAVTKSSLISIEVKTYANCVVKGDENNRYWTICYRSGNRTILNPINQNRIHVTMLKDIFGQHIPCCNIVVFSNGCNLMVDRITLNDVYVVNMAELWYTLIDLKFRGKSVSNEDMRNIESVLNGFVVRSSELYSLHQRQHFNKSK